MIRRSLYFEAPYRAAVREEVAPVPGRGELLVETTVSAISAGTELLFYRDQIPAGMTTDSSIEALANETTTTYPLKYGYAAVGYVIGVGEAVDSSWLGKRLFAFNPHESVFCVSESAALPIPSHITDEKAALLPNMETAVSFVMDGMPVIGERVAVFGQGIVGLLTMSLLSKFPLLKLVAVDAYQLRREAALHAGAHHALDASVEAIQEQLMSVLAGEADLQFELSGNPNALNCAIEAAGYAGRIVVGSWYGVKQATLNLGGRFHRNHIRLISSQVSTLAPQWRGSWTKARRFELALAMLDEIDPTPFISHRFDIQSASEAYRLLDTSPETAIQCLFTYE